MANSSGVVLLNAVSAAGAGAAQAWPGGRGTVSAAGTFGGTSVTVEYQSANGTWIPVQALSQTATFTTVALTAAGMFQLELPPGQIRAVATGGTPSALTVRVDRTLVG